MSPNVTRILCIIFYVLLLVLILLVIGLFVFEYKYNSSSCGLSAELLEIVSKQNRSDDSDPNANDPNFDFTGSYELTKSENFDKFLEELGVGYFQRTIASKSTSKYTITKNNDVYTLKTSSPFRTSEISFKLNGQEFEEERADGTEVKSSVVRKGRKWIHTQRSGDQVVTIVRDFKDDHIVVSGTLNGITFLRIYTKTTASAEEDQE